MRTDSTRISNEARAYAKEYIVKKYGENYYENRYYKTKQNKTSTYSVINPLNFKFCPVALKLYVLTSIFTL